MYCMDRILRYCVGIVPVLLIAGCSSGGPSTVPVKGTLTIDGQPANNITITFSPLDASLEAATGTVTNGQFELFSGVEGKPGAVPGKYKIVLAATAGSLDDAMKMMQSSEGGGPPTGDPTAKANKAPFPDKYLSAGTSDKEVEVTSGSNDIKIEITSGAASGGTPEETTDATPGS